MNTAMTKLKKKSGFTLVELLIVVAIIAVLAAIAIPAYNAQLEKARDRVDEANVRTAESMAVADYLLNMGETGYTEAKTYGFDEDTEKHTITIASGEKGTLKGQGKENNDNTGNTIQVVIGTSGQVTSAGWVSAGT